MTMKNVLKHLVEATSIEAVWAILTKEMQKRGFDRLLYGFTRFRTATNLGNRDDMMVLANHSDDYVEKFFTPDIFTVAPMVTWASKNVGAMSWSWISDHNDELTKKQQRVLEFNRSHGVIAGYTISFPDSSSRQKAAIALTAREGISQTEVDALWRRKGEEIHLLTRWRT